MIVGSLFCNSFQIRSRYMVDTQQESFIWAILSNIRTTLQLPKPKCIYWILGGHFYQLPMKVQVLSSLAANFFFSFYIDILILKSLVLQDYKTLDIWSVCDIAKTGWSWYGDHWCWKNVENFNWKVNVPLLVHCCWLVGYWVYRHWIISVWIWSERSQASHLQKSFSSSSNISPIFRLFWRESVFLQILPLIKWWCHVKRHHNMRAV